MKRMSYLLLNPKVHSVAFILTCTLMVGGAWEMKTQIDFLTAKSDELQERFNKPSQFFLYMESKRAAVRAPTFDLPVPPAVVTNFPAGAGVS